VTEAVPSLHVDVRVLPYETARATLRAAAELGLGSMAFAVGRDAPPLPDVCDREAAMCAAAIKERWEGEVVAVRNEPDADVAARLRGFVARHDRFPDDLREAVASGGAFGPGSESIQKRIWSIPGDARQAIRQDLVREIAALLAERRGKDE
jgi:hypothetical protein